MPHTRKRYAEPLVARSLKHSAIVGVLGQRQVGKTTLIETVAADYATLDREDTLRELEADPELFIQNRPCPFAIDEAQLAPRIFPALKEEVRKRKKMGQFVLSGSVRFTSRKAIRESLTGRISFVEILPFTRAEADGRPLPDTLKLLSGARNQRDLEHIFEKSTAKLAHFESYLQTGGLPGIGFFRSAHVRSDRLQSQLDTLLNRDLRLVQNSSLPYQAIRGVLEHLAMVQGEPFELKEAVRATQVSAVTIKRLLFSLEALFLIRPILCTGDLKKGTYFLEDQGMASWLARSTLEGPGDIIRALYANLRQELHYRPERNGRIYQYRTKHNVEVPLVFDATDVKVALIPSLEAETRFNPKVIATAQAFLSKHRDFKMVIAHAGSRILAKNDRLFLIPFTNFI